MYEEIYVKYIINLSIGKLQSIQESDDSIAMKKAQLRDIGSVLSKI